MLVSKKRIIFNVIASYGRSLFSIGCAIITAGWIFNALGEVNYGLYGVVGGLTAFVGFINGTLSGSIGRFYAYSVGEAYKNPELGIENCRKWFNTAVTIHSVIPIILIIIGYPLGAYAITHWLTIPANKIADCIWVWRFSCISCFIGMISVPFNAMYEAKQYIAELTIYSFFTTIVNLLFVIYMHYHPREWLVSYAAWVCAIGLIPQIIIPIRAYIIFPECRFKRVYLFNMENVKQIFVYSGFQGIGCFCSLLRIQGFTILTNIYFGPAVNAAMSIGTNVVNHASTLSASINRAFAPAITNACGAKDFVTMRKIAMQLNKFATLTTLFFALPLMLELPKILELWLKKPPQYTVGLAYLALGIAFVNNISTGHMIAVDATGKIRGYYIVLGAIAIFTLPMAWIAIKLGGNVYTMQEILLFMIGLNTLGRVFFGRRQAKMGYRPWISQIVIPLIVVILITIAFGWLPHLFMKPTISRILVTAIATELAFLPSAWFIVLDKYEKDFVICKIKKYLERFGV